MADDPRHPHISTGYEYNPEAEEKPAEDKPAPRKPRASAKKDA